MSTNHIWEHELNLLQQTPQAKKNKFSDYSKPFVNDIDLY